MVPYGAITLSFSHPLKDKSYRSKAIVTGIMIMLYMLYAALSLTDVWRYYSVWEFKGQQIVLQVCSSLASYGCQKAHRAAVGHC